jgi:hypothetical protein
MSPRRDLTASLTDSDLAMVERAQPYSMTPPARLVAVMDAVEYVASRGVPGAFVECGVWLGGSVLMMILALQRLGLVDRDVYLYDTFEGMTEPTAADTSRFDGAASDIWQQASASGQRAFDYLFNPEMFRLDKVREVIHATGYPEARIHFVVGPVEETVPGTAPDEIALLRLDTDWYESTRHEMAHLYPRLSPGGVLIVDDYGHWEGARRAVDEHLATAGETLLLSRIDYSARIGVRQAV